MADQFPITQTMQDNIKFLSINSQIISGILEIRPDRDGNMPTDEDIRRRFWGAFNRLNEEVRTIQAQRKTDSLRAENDKLQERIKELEAEANTKPKNIGKIKTVDQFKKEQYEAITSIGKTKPVTNNGTNNDNLPF